jgi:protein SCO1/2
MDCSACIKLHLIQLALVLSAGCSPGAVELHGRPYQAPAPAPGFAIPSNAGSTFDLANQRGRIVLLYFGYTFCPDVCPATLAELRQIFIEDPSLMDSAVVAMVTVDPERDTLPHLREYLARFNPQFIGLRAEGEELDSLLDAYGVFAERDPESDPEYYLVTHTARLFLIDSQGLLRTSYAFGTPIEEIKADLQVLLEIAG